MIPGTIPQNDAERVEALKQYSILDTVEEKEYDEITLLASHICNTPISLISLVDEKRQWFKSHHGLDAEETPREIAFCGHAINQKNSVFIVPDSRQDERFFDNPLVTEHPNVVFYAGIPLVDSTGYALGTLCVIDNKPNELNQQQIDALFALSNQVIRLFELRKKRSEMEVIIQQLEEQNTSLTHFAHVAAHDIKSPLSTISMLTELLESEYPDVENEESNPKHIIQLISKSSQRLSKLIDGILLHSKNTSNLEMQKSTFLLNTLITEVISFFPKEQLDLTCFNTNISIFTHKIALEQILINVVTNAIKYNDKDKVKIIVSVEEMPLYYSFSIHDNGPGIEPQYHEQVFKLFEKLTSNDRFGQSGNGIGLATVKHLVSRLGGEIKLYSEPGDGLNFTFTIKK